MDKQDPKPPPQGPNTPRKNGGDVPNMMVSPSAQSLPAALPSPASMSGNIHVPKRTSPFTRRGNLARVTSSRHSNASIHFVKERYISVRQRCQRELGASAGLAAFDTSHSGLTDWIRRERMDRVPHRGGLWDRVLISVAYFAGQVNRLSEAIESFTLECEAASNLLYGQCLILLELGHENAEPLQAAFDLFYQLGLELSPLLRAENALRLAPSIMENVARAFSELLNIVSGIAIGYYSAVHASRNVTTRLDIYATFGVSIDNYRSRVKTSELEIWDFELRAQGYDESVQIKTLQEWLAPQDQVVAFLASNHISLANRPEEYTCVWFQPHLNQFFKSSDKVLLVEGNSGSGKTTLANWVANRLQRPITGRMVPTLSFFFNTSIAAQVSCASLLKTLLFQLLSSRIGDLDPFIAVFHAFTESKALSSATAQEERLWEALKQALSSIGSDDEEIAIIIDGLDEMEGLKPIAKKVSQKLQAIAHELPNLRILIFSQPLDVRSEKCTEIEMSVEYLYDDLQTIFRQGLSRSPYFTDRSMVEQISIVDGLLGVSDGSMLLATLSVAYLTQQATVAGFNQAYDALMKSPTRSAKDLVQRILSVAKLDVDSVTAISILAAAKRPLFISEIDVLLRTDPKGASISKTFQLGQIIQSITAFTTTVEGLITLRHDAVKQALINITDTSDASLHLKERHKDLLCRLLVSSGRHLRDIDEPRLGCLTVAETDTRIGSRRLLEYTVRYWVTHFKLSSLFKVQGDLQLPPEFISIFPSSVSYALLEANCWGSQYEVAEFLTTAYRVRKQLFGLEHLSVLQSAITCAIFHENVSKSYHKATEWYALAVRIGKTVLGLQAELVITCSTRLLQISESLITTKRNEIMTYREEVLLVLVSSYTHQYGPRSDEVIRTYEALIELYVSIGEETKATEIGVQIREGRIGFNEHRDSTERDNVSRHLDVILRKHGHEEKIEGYQTLLFGYMEEAEESWTILHVESMIKFALDLVNGGKSSGAEEILVELWLKLSDYCLNTQSVEWHEKRIEVMLRYAFFLHSQTRFGEASAVLISCWSEYSTHQVSMFESIIVLLKEIGVCMKAVGMASLSLTVLQRCWSWFKSTHKEESSVFKEIVEIIATTSSEIVKGLSAGTDTTKTTTSSSETVIREVFESFFSEETQVTTTTIEMCNSLITIYSEQENWSEAVSVIKSTLSRTWASFFAESIDSVRFESTFSSESTLLILQLARCYINQKRYDKAEYLYLRLYRVYCKAHKFDDVDVVKFRELYIRFLIKYEMHIALISFYQELLVEYRPFYGPDNTKTIATLYSLGDICRKHHLTYGYWIEYYSEIHVALNNGSLICHESALRALIVVADYYYELQRYSESLVYLKSIIATFCQSGTKYKIFQDTVFVHKTFERYYRAIEETQIEIHEHIKILKEIREACYRFFGESSDISVDVTVTLAEICTKSEKYQYEAMSYYEHILKYSKTVSTSVVKRSQNTLRSLYLKQITSTSISQEVTKETLEKATYMTSERYTEIRKTHPATHETTLTALKELVILYQKQERVDLAVKELQSLVVDCVTSTTSTKNLIETARFIASLLADSYTAQGVQLIRELKLQTIYKARSKSAIFDVTKVGRSCFAFIASFEFHLHARISGSVATYMAETLAESISYERLVSSIKGKAQIGAVILLGARLRNIHFQSNRAEDFEFVERQVLDYFTATEVTVVKDSSKASIRGFVRILLRFFSTRNQPREFVASAAHAAVVELNVYLTSVKYREAVDLAQVVYRFLKAHEGLSNPTEITLGFQLCLMMAGRGEFTRTSPADEETTNKMLALSQAILGEIFDICKNNKIDLVRCPLQELDELISLLGDQRDTDRLLWLLESLWDRRGAQTWGSEVKLTLGVRLVQARFQAGDHQIIPAIQLAEDVVYNLRRTHGPRHKQTLAVYEMLASIYTSAGHYYTAKRSTEGADATLKKRDVALAFTYFKKAITTNEDLLKLLVDINMDDSEDDDDDGFSVGSASHIGSIRGRGSAYGLGRRISSKKYIDMSLSIPLSESKNDSTGLSATESERHQEVSREVLVDVARKHLRMAKLAVQRYGGWERLTGRRFDGLTTRIWQEFGNELKMKEDMVLSTKWKVSGYGGGKAEGGIEEDGFKTPGNWSIS